MGLSDLFHRETPQQKVRRYKRSLDRTCRQLDRQCAKLTQQERKIQADMRTMARKNQDDVLRISARDLVRTRKFNQKMYRMRMQIQGVSLRIQTMQSTADMAHAMKGVTSAMKSMNKQLNLPQIQRILADFEKSNAQMAEKGEVMNDTLDTVIDEEGDEDADVDEEIEKVIEEANIQFRNKMGVTNVTPVAVQKNEESELDARLEAFKASMAK